MTVVVLGGVIEIHRIGGACAGLSPATCRGDRVVDACALVRIEAWDRAGRFRSRFRSRLAVGSALQHVLLAPRNAPFVLRAVGAFGPVASWLYRSTRGTW